MFHMEQLIRVYLVLGCVIMMFSYWAYTEMMNRNCKVDKDLENFGPLFCVLVMGVMIWPIALGIAFYKVYKDQKGFKK